MKQSLTIAWLYPDLMSTYGDHGNILALTHRLTERGIDAEIKSISIDTPSKQLEECDLVFMGGAQDKQQQIVSDDFLKGKAETLKSLIESETPGLYICGAYQFLGTYYKEADGTVIDGLGIIDFYTENPGTTNRLTGNLAFKADFLENSPLIIGFENHGGRTYLGKGVLPLGTVVKGYGNNGKDQTEGARYKNSFCSYSHGPILPKNPVLTDHLLTLALEKKYGEKVSLSKLDDSLETEARKIVARKLGITV